MPIACLWQWENDFHSGLNRPIVYNFTAQALSCSTRSRAYFRRRNQRRLLLDSQQVSAGMDDPNYLLRKAGFLQSLWMAMLWVTYFDFTALNAQRFDREESAKTACMGILWHGDIIKTSITFICNFAQIAREPNHHRSTVPCQMQG